MKSKVQRLRETASVAKKMENEVRKKRGRTEKTLFNSLESEVLNPEKVLFSHYHGGDMEGESIRRLMNRGVAILNKCADHIVEKRGDAVDAVEVRDVSTHHGQMFQLLDGIVSFLNMKRGKVTEEVVAKLEERLEAARLKWNELGLSMTPKWHMLLNHAVEILKLFNGGLIELGEDRIERAHQVRERDRQRISRMRNYTKMKESQTKFQNLRMMGAIKKVQAVVAQSSKRKLSRDVSLAETNCRSKKIARDEMREEILNNIQAQPRVVIPKPQAYGIIQA